MTTNRCSPSSSKPDGRTDGAPPPHAAAAARPASQLVGGDRPLPCHERAADREQRQRVLHQHGQGRAGARRHQVVGLAVVGIVTEDLRALRDDLDVVDPEGRDEVAQDVGLLPHRVDEHPAPLRTRQGEHEARHAAARSEVEAAATVLQAIDQRQGRQRVEQVEARDRCGLGDPREVDPTVGREQERDESLDRVGEAGRQMDWTVAEDALELDAGSARIGLRRIGLGQEKCSFERPFGLPGEWSASRPAFASAPSHPRLPYSVARRSRTVNLTARGCGSQPDLSTICAHLHDLWITRPDILALMTPRALRKATIEVRWRIS